MLVGANGVKIILTVHNYNNSFGQIKQIIKVKGSLDTSVRPGKAISLSQKNKVNTQKFKNGGENFECTIIAIHLPQQSMKNKHKSKFFTVQTITFNYNTATIGFISVAASLGNLGYSALQ